MENLKQCIISIVAVAVFSAILLRLVNGKSPSYKLIKLMCGILMILTVVSPWTRLSPETYMGYLDAVEADALYIREGGEFYMHEQLGRGIKEKTEAYILDKAALLGADIHVSVTCDSSEIPKPISVEIKGNISPYAKGRLQQVLQNDIGIPEDKQTWT